MPRRTLLIIVAGVLVLGVALLVHSVRPQTALPSKPPADLTISWTTGGGMEQDGTRVVLYGKNGHATSWYVDDAGRHEREDAFSITDSEYATLYALLRSHGADTVGQQTSTAVDGDNAGYDLSWGTTSVHVWGMAVPASDAERYRAVYAGLSALFTPYLALPAKN